MAQRRVLEAIAQAIHDAHATPREALALEEAGIVESHLTQLHGGDRDSTGFLQQRPSQGWGPVGESPYKDAMQFLSHAKRVNRQGFHGSAGALAQAVQRSAYPARYDEVRGKAARLGLPRTARATSMGIGATRLVPGSPGVPAAPDVISGLRDALSTLQGSPPAISGPAAPSFAASAPTPKGFAPAPSSGAPQVAPSGVDASLAQVAQSVDTSIPAGSARSVPGAPQAGGGGAGGGSLVRGARGRVAVAPGANAHGRGLKPVLVTALERLAGTTGETARVGTGTNHSYLTTSGNVSEHVTGNAADLPMVGKKLTRTLAAALFTYGNGRTVQWLKNDGSSQNVKVTRKNVAQLASSGGLFNIPRPNGGRFQVIGNTHIGGDHTNHVHVGVR